MSSVVTLCRYKACVVVMLKNGNIVHEDRFYLRDSAMSALDAVEADVAAIGDKLCGVRIFGQLPGQIWAMTPCVTKGFDNTGKAQTSTAFNAQTTASPEVQQPKRVTLADIMLKADWTWYCDDGPCVYPTLKPKTSHVLSRSTTK